MKKILTSCGILVAAVLFSGCSLVPGTTTTPGTSTANFLKSSDGGVTWTPKVKIDDKKTIAAANVLSVAVHPTDPKIVYIGTEKNGLFITKDGADTWQSMAFAQKVYGLVFDKTNPLVIYASGVYNGRGKIFKRDGEQAEWKEIYTEPSDGTYITALGVNPSNGSVIYAGTSDGVIIKSIDGGVSWRNVKKAEGPVTSISFDCTNREHIYFGIFQRGILETMDGGMNLADITNKFSSLTSGTSNNVYSVVADPSVSGVVYIGTDQGITRGAQTGGKWDSLNIIASSTNYPIRALAINPANSKEIMYAGAGVIYRTIDGGTQWSTFQLDTKKSAGVIQYNPSNPRDIFVGLRSL